MGDSRHNILRRTILTAMAVWVSASVSLAAATSPPSAGAKRVAILARQLSSQRFRVRQQARVALLDLPNAQAPEAVRYLRKYLSNPNAAPETRASVAGIMPTLRLQAQRAALRLGAAQWLAINLLQAYRRPGKTSAAWDRAARTVLRLAALRHSAAWNSARGVKLKKAVQLIWKHRSCPSYVVAFAVVWAKMHDKQANTAKLLAWVDQARSTARRDYVHWIIRARLEALGMALFKRQGNYDQEMWRYRTAVHLLADAAAVFATHKEPPQEALTRAARQVRRPLRGLHPHRLPDRGTGVIKALSRDPANQYGQLLAAQWSTFISYFKTAAATRNGVVAFKKIWRRQPFRSTAAADVMACEIAMGAKLPEMQKWFKRAIVARPDNYLAYSIMYRYLRKHERSSPAVLLRFGHTALDTGLWNTPIPWMVVSIRKLCARQTQNVAAYYRRTTTWLDIKAACVGYLRRHPKSKYYRSEFAKFAAEAGHWKTAALQFKRLGNKFDHHVFSSRAIFLFYRAKSLRLARSTKRKR